MALKGETRHPLFPRLPLMALGALTFLCAVYGGLLRLPWPGHAPSGNWLTFHGPLMVSGFLGTLIGVERAVGLGRNWVYLGPAAGVAGSLLLLTGSQSHAGHALYTAASAVLFLAALLALFAQPALHHGVMLVGAGCWLSGNVLWLTDAPIPSVVLWWAGFLILTVAGERLELTRFFKPSVRSRAWFLAGVALYLVGTLWALPHPGVGTRLASLGLLTLSAWFLVLDPARRQAFQPGQVGFTSACLFSGYVFLGVAGIVGLGWAPVASGRFYDAFLHCLFLGFILSMVFGHAPLVFEAVVERPYKFLRSFWVHLFLLDLSLALRVACDLGDWMDLRRWAGLGNAAALALFFLNNVLAVRAGARQNKGNS
jgi:hypothetical protein